MSTRRSFARSLDSLESLYEFTENVLVAAAVADTAKPPVHLAMEELFVNMVKYNPVSAGDIRIEIDATGDIVRVTLTEFGVDPFDVTQPRNVDAGVPIEQRRPGGLGLHLVQNMVDTLEYEYDDGRSKVRFTKQSGTPDV